MAQVARDEATIAVPIPELWSVLLDFEHYPLWARDLKSADVLERDDEGRGVVVRFRAAAMGISTTYTLRYAYADAPHRLPWRLVRGDIMRRIDGSYRLDPIGDDGDLTRVRYDLTVDLIVPLPGFVRHRASMLIVHNALRHLREYVEP